MNRFVSIAFRCCMICVAGAPLHSQTMGRPPAKAATADSEHISMMSDSSKTLAGKRTKTGTARDSAMAMKKSSTSSGMGMRKGMARELWHGHEKANGESV